MRKRRAKAFRQAYPAQTNTSNAYNGGPYGQGNGMPLQQQQPSYQQQPAFQETPPCASHPAYADSPRFQVLRLLSLDRRLQLPPGRLGVHAQPVLESGRTFALLPSSPFLPSRRRSGELLRPSSRPSSVDVRPDERAEQVDSNGQLCTGLYWEEEGRGGREYTPRWVGGAVEGLGLGGGLVFPVALDHRNHFPACCEYSLSFCWTPSSSKERWEEVQESARRLRLRSLLVPARLPQAHPVLLIPR